jgi:hypothetical protein
MAVGQPIIRAGGVLAVVKVSTRLKYRQLHRCKANYESRTAVNGGQAPQCNCAAPQVGLADQACAIRS